MLAPYEYTHSFHYEYSGKEAKCEGPGLLAVGLAMVGG